VTADRAADLVYFGLILLFALSALAARRIPLRRTLQMALAWIAIFGIGFLILAQRDRLAALWPGAAAPQGSVQIPIAGDGHFWVMARINGVPRRMLVDSGATTTALSVATAKAAGLDLTESPFPRIIDTANGTITADHATIRELEIGAIALDDVGAVVSPAFGDQDVIGMNVLRRLKGWKVDRGTLVLNPQD